MHLSASLLRLSCANVSDRGVVLVVFNCLSRLNWGLSRVLWVRWVA